MTRPPRMRPVFTLPVPEDGRKVLDRLREKLSVPESDLVGEVKPPWAYLHLPDKRSRFLSPHLNLQLLEENGRTVLHGRFSPRPNVWMGFMALYFFLGMIGLAGLVFGFAQLPLGGSPWAIWAAPVSLALIGFTYGAAFIGQGLSTEDMYELRSFVEGAVRDSR